MQVNVAHFTEDVSSDRNLRPGELFGMKKSASSSQIHETRFNSEGNQATTNADTQSSGYRHYYIQHNVVQRRLIMLKHACHIVGNFRG